MRSQPIVFRLFCLVVVVVADFVIVVIVDVVFVIVVVLDVDIIVKTTLKLDLRLLVMEAEVGWVACGVVGWDGGVQTNFNVKPNSDELS